MRRVPVVAALLAGTLALGCGGDRARGDAFQPLTVGDRAPEYAVRTLSGDSVRIGAGEPVTLLNVWATWCESCREEFADLERLQRDAAPRGLRVVAVSVDQPGMDSRVTRFAAAQGATFAVAHDPTGGVQQRFQVVGVPSSYLIGRDGRVLWSYVGSLTAADSALRAAVERALRSSGS